MVNARTIKYLYMKVYFNYWLTGRLDPTNTLLAGVCDAMCGVGKFPTYVNLACVMLFTSQRLVDEACRVTDAHERLRKTIRSNNLR